MSLIVGGSDENVLRDDLSIVSFDLAIKIRMHMSAKAALDHIGI